MEIVFIEFGRVQQGHLKKNRESWSVLEDFGKCGWRERYYSWVGINIVRIECDIGPKKDMEKKEAMLFLLCFLLMTRVKATPLTFSTLTAISISGKGVRIRLEP